MMGMATPAQVAELGTLESTAFDRLFLQLMVRHHGGAIDMVETLHDQPGTAYDPVMFEFTNDLVKEQQAEIDRMNAILAELSDDPRANLAAGSRCRGSDQQSAARRRAAQADRLLRSREPRAACAAYRGRRSRRGG